MKYRIKETNGVYVIEQYTVKQKGWVFWRWEECYWEWAVSPENVNKSSLVPEYYPPIMPFDSLEDAQNEVKRLLKMQPNYYYLDANGDIIDTKTRVADLRRDFSFNF
jgi:hypothetical protein